MIIRIFATLGSILLIPLLLLTTAAKIGEVAAQNSATAGPGTQQPAQLLCNTNAIAIPSAGAATPYPAIINVSGYPTNVERVRVHLLALNHTWPDDLDMLLVGPQGQNLILMSDAGGTYDLVNVDLTFDDAATDLLPDSAQIFSGVYKPTNYGTGDTFPQPAPDPSSATELAIFAGTDPNGAWSLYVVDDNSGDSGQIAGGWCLEVAPLPQPAISLKMTVGTEPESCAVADTLTVNAGAEVTYCYTVANAGNVTLDRHDLQDSQLGDLLNFYPLALQPGAIFSVTRPATLYTTTVSTAVWTAYNPGPINSATASAAAAVNVLAPHISLTPTHISSVQIEVIPFTQTMTLSNSGAGVLNWTAVTAAPSATHEASLSACQNPAFIPWLSVAPTGGSVLPGAEQSATVTLTPLGLLPGNYSATLCVHSNDFANRVLAIPVEMTVTPAQKAYLPLVLRP